MTENQRENEHVPEFVTQLTQDGELWAVEIKRAGTVCYVGDGFKTRDAAERDGVRYLRCVLKLRLQAAGVARRGTYPVVDQVDQELWISRWAHNPEGGAWKGNFHPLEGEATCRCLHLEGIHRIDGNCDVPDCGCEDFVAAAPAAADGAVL
jgi:hypothetical protein